MKEDSPPTFEEELRYVINKYSKENASNTPDYILAQYLVGCLDVFAVCVQQRETWYGRDSRPTQHPLLNEKY